MLRLITLFIVLALPATAQNSVVTAHLPGAQERGAATYRYLGFAVYDARLFTPGGAALNWSTDMALELKYLRNLTRNDIVQATVVEFERNGGALPVEDQLNTCFADVSKGDRFMAVSKGANTIGFWLNGRKTCTLSHPNIRKRFMGIWLGENTRSRRFTQALSGQ